jgi:hypothetical protein
MQVFRAGFAAEVDTSDEIRFSRSPGCRALAGYCAWGCFRFFVLGGRRSLRPDLISSGRNGWRRLSPQVDRRERLLNEAFQPVKV